MDGYDLPELRDLVEALRDGRLTDLDADASWHGTARGYANHGCRQPCCKAAHAAAQRKRQDRLSQLPWDQVPHGTANGYVNYRCRCVDCKAAKRVSNRGGRA